MKRAPVWKPTKTDMADFFVYTSGRWIYNESLRTKERDLRFDVPALCRIIESSSSGASNIARFVKFAEGGFNRIFQATLDNGQELLARLPYPSTEPRHYAVASEVATLAFLRLHGLPVPKVCAWSSTSSNDVGTEYIILEKIHGKPLTEVWFTLNSQDRLKVIEQIVELEATLFNLHLPASGSLYFPQDLNESERSRSSSLWVDDHEFCVGPMAHYSWWHSERAEMKIDRGPYLSANELFRAVGTRELQWTLAFAQPRQHYEKLYREVHKFQNMSPQDNVNALEKYNLIAKCLANSSHNSLYRPILRHPDLSLNNIIVSDDLVIAGLLDWQHATILPLLLAAGIPKDFQNYGDLNSAEMVTPERELPEDFDSLDLETQEAVRLQHVKRLSHFLYGALTLQLNSEHYDAIFNDAVTLHQRLYKHAGHPWEGDSVTLQAEMIRVIENWSKLVSANLTTCESCPAAFDKKTAKFILTIHEEQQAMDSMVEQMRAVLDVDVYGWVPNNGYAEAMALKQDIKHKMLANSTDEDKLIIENNFPFDDYDEAGLSNEASELRPFQS